MSPAGFKTAKKSGSSTALTSRGWWNSSNFSCLFSPELVLLRKWKRRGKKCCFFKNLFSLSLCEFSLEAENTCLHLYVSENTKKTSCTFCAIEARCKNSSCCLMDINSGIRTDIDLHAMSGRKFPSYAE